ncbi:MAG: LysR family transcriptional regulator, partial [Clostridiales bacterium]
SNRISFAICIPRASYITYAFSCFVNKLPKDKDLLIDFKETNSINAINNVVNSDCNLAIVRYPLIYEDYFLQMIQDKHLQSEDIWQYEYIVLLSLEHPLALQETVDYNQLVQGIEILHGDSTTPYLSCGEIKRANQSQEHRNIIYVYERGSQFDFLQEVPGSYMWASPVPEIVLKHYGLVQRQCPLANYQYKDILIYNQGYKLSHLDKTFIEELLKIRNGLS